MSIVIAVAIAAVGIGYAMSRLAKLRKEFPELADKKEPRKSRRDKRLEQIRGAEPEYVAPSLDDLIAEEIADEGIDTIEGGVGLPPAVMLKAYKRDLAGVAGCPREKLRIVIADGVQPETAEFDDVRLTCDDPLPQPTMTEAAAPESEEPGAD